MDCKICLRKYNVTVPNRTPRILTKCGHTMCHYCIQQQTDDEKIVCPFDREVTEVTNSAARNLPKNYALLEVIERFGNEEDDVEDPLDNVVEEMVEENPGNVVDNVEDEENAPDAESSSSWETSSESDSSESDDVYAHSRFFRRDARGNTNRR
ncbi:hypothetical protein CRE_12027 [Caenorhabditis remanei]|uniref:RING-type domain-containing protein n=1 Tax=Caenorhabditis remanei TaxID=31234 RepID=E3MPU7_CAERE|nr:hypothetical protein CRE_12027 [Caenorhabditis remanei]